MSPRRTKLSDFIDLSEIIPNFQPPLYHGAYMVMEFIYARKRLYYKSPSKAREAAFCPLGNVNISGK